jgi:hypothetical protein
MKGIKGYIKTKARLGKDGLKISRILLFNELATFLV